MARIPIGVGTTANDGTGDPVRTVGQNLNTMTTEIYGLIGNSTTASPALAGLSNSAATAAIIASASALNVLGGGYVLLPAGTITLTATLPLYNNVVYLGAPSSADFITYETYSGTVLVGDGTFAGIAYGGYSSTTTLAEDLPAKISGVQTVTTYSAAMVRGAGAKNLVFKNFLYGTRVGGLYNPGCGYGSQWENLTAVDCPVGFYFENCIGTGYKNVNVYNPQPTTHSAALGAATSTAVSPEFLGGAGFVFTGSGGAVYGGTFNNGNSDFERIFVQWGANSTVKTRAITFGQRGNKQAGNAFLPSLNAITARSIQTNKSGSTTAISQSASWSGAAAVTVSDSSQFQVGMPVSFSASTAGYTVNQIYFVNSVNTDGANTIRLGDVQPGYATPTDLTKSAGTGTIKTLGFPGLEIAGVDGCGIQPSLFTGIDLEGRATVRALIQNASNVTAINGYVFADAQGTDFFQHYAMRASSACTIIGAGYAANPGQFDIDAGSQGTMIFGNKNITSSTYTGLGISQVYGTYTRYVAGTAAVYLYGWQKPEISINKAMGNLEFGASTISIPTTQLVNGGHISDPAYGLGTSSIVYNGGASGTINLVTIPANGDGIVVNVSNPTANAVTIASGGSQNIIGKGASATTVSLAANTACRFIACNNAGTLYWSYM